MISKPIEVKALKNFRIQITFEDGIHGEIDLSHLKGKGVFKLWDDYENFNRVYVDDETQAVAWNREVEIDPNKLYLNLIGKTFEQWRNENLRYAADK